MKLKRLHESLESRFGLAVLLFFSVLARFSFLGLRPLEGDEGIIIKIAKSETLRGLIDNVSKDVHPPLYHAAEFVSFKLFPVSEFSARFLSAFCGVFAAYFIYLLFSRLANRKVAFWVSALSIINPVLTYHFAEVRPYGLLVMLVFAQLYLFAKLLDKQKYSDLLWFFVLSSLLILTQYISFALLAGEFLYILISSRKSLRLATVLSGLGSVVVFIVFWGRAFLNQIQGRSLEQSQILNIRQNAIGLFNAFYRFLSGRLFLDLDPSISKNLAFLKAEPVLFLIFVLSILAGLSLLIWGVINLYKQNRKNFWFIIIVFAPLLLSALLSSEIGPRASRYLLFLAPFCLYIIVELMSNKKSLIKNLVFSIFIVLYIASFIHGIWFERKKPGVNAIANYLQANANSGDSILIRGGFGGGEELVLRYYLGGQADDLKINDLYGDYQVGNLNVIKSRDPLKQISELQDANVGKNVWFYDMTYAFEDKTTDVPFVKIDLGKDKENKELLLYKF